MDWWRMVGVVIGNTPSSIHPFLVRVTRGRLLGRAKLLNSSLTPRGRYVSVHRISPSIPPLCVSVRRTFAFRRYVYLNVEYYSLMIPQLCVSVRRTFASDSAAM